MIEDIIAEATASLGIAQTLAVVSAKLLSDCRTEYA